MTAAYATFINNDKSELCLVGFSSNLASSVELHSTEPVGGPDSSRVAMRPIPQLCIEPGGRAELAPGGKHLMVMGIDTLPQDAVELRIGSSDGRLFSASFSVKPFNYTAE